MNGRKNAVGRRNSWTAKRARINPVLSAETRQAKQFPPRRPLPLTHRRMKSFSLSVLFPSVSEIGPYRNGIKGGLHRDGHRKVMHQTPMASYGVRGAD